MLTQISDAFHALEQASDKCLPLNNRRELLFLFGNYDEEIDISSFTSSKKYRATLALKCFYKILPLWNIAFPDFDPFSEILSLLQDYLCNGDGYESLNEKSDEFFECLEEETSKPELYLLAQVGYTLVDAVNCALSDEEILSSVFDNATDNDVDSFSWDAAYRACLVYESAFGNDEETILYYRNRFWIWYIEEVDKLYAEYFL